MTKEEMEREVRKCFSLLMNGSPYEFKSAKKEIEKLWHQNHEEFKSVAVIALEYLPLFKSIKNTKNQAAFASGLSLFYLILGDEYFDILKDFTLKVLQSPNGSIRQSMLNTAEWLYVSLTSRISPFVYPKSKKLTEKQKFEQKQAKFQYINLVGEIELLIDISYEKNEYVKYIEDMKPSINKSLQFFWSRLTESRIFQKIMAEIQPVPIELNYRLPEQKFMGYKQKIHRS